VLDDASARHTIVILVSEMRGGNMDDSTATRDSAVAQRMPSRDATTRRAAFLRRVESRECCAT
jgi:hypothetical protein